MLKFLFKKDEIKLLYPFYLQTLISNGLLIVFIFEVFYFLDIGFSLFQIALLFSALNLSKILFEVPTGAIADIFGRKFSVLTGLILCSFLIFIIFFIKEFYLILLIYFLYGGFFTLISGADVAWVTDNLKFYKKENLLKEFFIKLGSIKSLGMVLVGLIGAFFVGIYGLKVIFLVSGIGLFVSSLFLLIPKEHKITLETKNIFKQTKESLKYSYKNKVVRYIFIATLFMGLWICFGAGRLLWQSFFQSLNMSAYLFGIIFTIIGILGIFAPYLSKPLSKYIKLENKQIFFIMGIISLIVVSTIFSNNYIYAAIIYILILSFYYVFLPVESHFFQRNVPSNIRATTTSSKSLIQSLAFIIGNPLAAYIVSLITIKYAISLSFLFLIPVMLLYYKLK